VSSPVKYPNVRTHECGRCEGFGCVECRKDGRLPHCEACGSSPDVTALTEHELDAWLSFVDSHLGLCVECVAIEADLAGADTQRAPLLDHESGPSSLFVDGDESEVA
jgi:hypothetical protein